MKISPELAQALTNLRANQDFHHLLKALAEDLEMETTRALSLEGPQCHRAQGAVLKLREIFTDFESAPKTLDKLKPR